MSSIRPIARVVGPQVVDTRLDRRRLTGRREQGGPSKRSRGAGTVRRSQQRTQDLPQRPSLCSTYSLLLCWHLDGGWGFRGLLLSMPLGGSLGSRARTIEYSKPLGRRSSSERQHEESTMSLIPIFVSLAMVSQAGVDTTVRDRFLEGISRSRGGGRSSNVPGEGSCPNDRFQERKPRGPRKSRHLCRRWDSTEIRALKEVWERE